MARVVVLQVRWPEGYFTDKYPVGYPRYIYSVKEEPLTWRQSETTGGTLGDKVVVRQFARANNGILAGADPDLDTMNTENDTEMKKEAEERTLHWMANVHDILEMW